MNKLKQFFDITMLKFILVGIVNTAVGMGVMFLFYNLFHFNYWISSASNYIVGSIVSYFLNKYFTFQNKSKDAKVIVKFIINITVCYLVAYGVAKPVVVYLFSSFSQSVQDNAAMLAGSIFFVGLNYIGQRFWAFKQD
ncbi:Putative flippase GtrA (transmembrane translocase of bactoprenol-linked glucose) [Ligilactobacillus sp. WC1T17]|uniref:Flippase GtrA (Transmembrane translocase of bactoprenol-linked glucose) n=1 Tax=Ligilactobacillus ruminis TaxID=1623 RepID=A0ABY1A8T8_9LACO|nr:Putative flippase GtrA (transmembrane translocase of bactoprenol-linked glucose) [Ligilactobacillus ruminis]